MHRRAGRCCSRAMCSHGALQNLSTSSAKTKKQDGLRSEQFVRLKHRMHADEKRIVYILRSVANTRRHYIGVTTDPREELERHNAGSCRQTAQNRPCSLIVRMEFATERSAKGFANYLKSGSGRAFAKRHF